MQHSWQLPAGHPAEYHAVEARRGREFVLRLTTGADVFLAIQQFARDRSVRFGKVHAVFMGGLQPARFLMWTPDTMDPQNWHNESPVTIHNLSMILSMSGIIHVKSKAGTEEIFPAIHFVIGGAWDVPTIGGHVLEGTIVKGVCQVFITEILGIDVLPPTGKIVGSHAEEYPENWYREIG